MSINNVLVDDLFKTENLSLNFSKITTKLGCKQQLSRVQSKDYRCLYSKDIEEFNYAF
jgi:hypothetical protein